VHKARYDKAFAAAFTGAHRAEGAEISS